jgi:hypothetical protein
VLVAQPVMVFKDGRELRLDHHHPIWAWKSTLLAEKPAAVRARALAPGWLRISLSRYKSASGVRQALR